MRRYGHIKPAAAGAGAAGFLFAPATAIKEPYKSRGKALLTEAGMRVVTGDSLDAAPQPFAAGSAALRLGDWQMALNQEVAALLPARGGYGCVHLLADAPLQATAALRPLWIGSSDLTYLQVPLLQQQGLIHFYGPMPCGQLAHPDEPGRRGYIDTLLGHIPEQFRFAEMEQLVPGRATGELRGGCLSILAAQCGTQHQLDGHDALLILEDVAEHPYRIERMLYQLRDSGVFEGVRGLIFGTFPNCTDRSGNPDLTHEICRAFSQSLNVPALFGCRFGHGEAAVPVPLGVLAELSADGIAILESPFL